MASFTPRRGLWVVSCLGLAACEMPPADVLDSPRILAIQATPAAFVPGEPLTVEALVWDVDGPLRWSACPVAWAPTDPPQCPAGEALPLGEGNPLTFTPPVEAPPGLPALPASWWLLAEGAGAIPAGRRVERDPGDGSLVNPPPFVIEGASGLLSPGATVTLAPVFEASEPPLDPNRVVVSWYVSAGTLEPARTVGLGPATFTAEGVGDGPVTIIAVARNLESGVVWAEATLEVTP